MASYIRNKLNVPIAFSITEPKKRFELAARGQRGDISRIKPEYTSDDSFIENNGVIFEVITQRQAESIVKKQVTNAQEKPTVQSMLRNEFDQPMGDVKFTDQKENAQSVGKVSVDGKNVSLDRVGPEMVDRPGSAGFETPEINKVSLKTQKGLGASEIDSEGSSTSESSEAAPVASGGSEDTSEKPLSAKEIVAKIKEAETVEEVNSLAEGNDWKTVTKAAEKRINELK